MLLPELEAKNIPEGIGYPAGTPPFPPSAVDRSPCPAPKRDPANDGQTRKSPTAVFIAVLDRQHFLVLKDQAKHRKHLMTDAHNKIVILETLYIYIGYYPGRINAGFPAGSTKATRRKPPICR